ncbi:MAG: flagellar biosynthetic protein FliR [Phycisphaerales bacterium]
MISYEPILSHVVPFMLVVARLGGLFLLAPILGNRFLPAKFRALLVVMLAAAVYPGLSSTVQHLPETTLLTLAPLIVTETLIGFTIGFIACLPIMCLDLAGYVMGHQMGLGLARVYNPHTAMDTDILGQLLMFIALGTFIALGGLEVLFVSLLSTYQGVPIGGVGGGVAPLDLVVGVLSSGVEMAARVAAPVVCIVFLLMISMGFIMKTMPQINILSVGFTVKILFGVGMVAAAIGSMHGAIQGELERVLNVVLDFGRTVG